MDNTENKGWIADLKNMTCSNLDTNIVIVFEKEKKILLPKIKNIPVDVLEKWAKMNEEEMKLEEEKIIAEAEDVFMEAFIEGV